MKVSFGVLKQNRGDVVGKLSPVLSSVRVRFVQKGYRPIVAVCSQLFDHVSSTPDHTVYFCRTVSAGFPLMKTRQNRAENTVNGDIFLTVITSESKIKTPLAFIT